MMKVKNLFHDMRKGAVTQIMKQSAGAADDAGFFIDGMMRRQQVERTRHQMHHADGMGKATVFGALIGKHRQAKLFNTSQTLKFGAINQVNNELVITNRFVQRNDIMKRVAIISLHED